MRLTLRRKLILSIGVPMLLTYVGLLVWDYARQISSTTQQMQELATERAQSAAATLDARLSSVMQVAETTASVLADRPSVTEPQVRAIMMGGLRQNPWTVAVFVTFDPSLDRAEVGYVRREGVRGVQAMEGGPSHAEQAWFDTLRQTLSPLWIAPHEDARISPDQLCTYLVPLKTAEGGFGGAVSISMRTEDLQQLRAFPERDAGPSGFGGGSDGGGFRDGREGPEVRRFDDRGLERLEGVRDRLRRNDGEPDPRRNPREAPASQPSTSATAPFGSEDFPPPGPPTDEGLRSTAGAPTSRPARTTGVLSNRASTTAPSERPEDAAVRPRAFVVVDGDGRIISSSDPSPRTKASIFEIAERRGMAELAKAGHDALAGESGVVRVRGAADLLPGPAAQSGRHQWIAFAPIRSTNWAFAAVLSEAEIMDPIFARMLSRALVLAAGLVVIVLVVMIVAIRISQPIERLAGAVDELGRGNLDIRVTDIRSRDEIGQLANGFNRMVGELKEHVAALTEQSAGRARVESELQIARTIQTDLLPRELPRQAEFEIFALNEPALQVAGDFYDFFYLPSGRLMFVVADVAGKGVPAALMMAVTRTIIRDLASMGFSCGEVVDRANIALARDSSGSMFVTALVAQFDPATGVVTFVNAGHPQPFIVRESGVVKQIDAPTSPLLGVFTGDDAEPYVEHQIDLSAGDTLVLFTDGVTEARNRADLELGTSGLETILRDSRPVHRVTVESLCRHVAERVKVYQSGRVTDDLTILCIRRRRLND